MSDQSSSKEDLSHGGTQKKEKNGSHWAFVISFGSNRHGRKGFCRRTHPVPRNSQVHLLFFSFVPPCYTAAVILMSDAIRGSTWSLDLTYQNQMQWWVWRMKTHSINLSDFSCSIFNVEIWTDVKKNITNSSRNSFLRILQRSARMQNQQTGSQWCIVTHTMNLSIRFWFKILLHPGNCGYKNSCHLHECSKWDGKNARN